MDILGSRNSTTERVWVPNPLQRGTCDIYQTCVITVFLCAWQAIHLNIAPPGEPAYKQILRKCGWALLAWLAPEYVAVTAWRV